jgi:hypothetical protein
MSDQEYYTARIPADIDRPDVVVGRLNFRQLAIIAATGAPCWLVFTAVHKAAPRAPMFVVAAPLVLVVLVAALIALGTRDGISGDRFALAALAHFRRPRLLINPAIGADPMPLPTVLPAAWRKAQGRPPASLVLPAGGVDEAGILDLREHGHAGIAACSTVNFSLRTPGEQNALVAGFGRFLNSLSGPVQILIRTRRIDLSTLVADLEHAAGGLEHPALEAAARDHAAFLAEISSRQQLLGRQVLLIAREPSAGGASEAAARISRRHAEAGAVLGGAQVQVSAFTPAGASALLADAVTDPHPHAVRSSDSGAFA